MKDRPVWGKSLDPMRHHFAKFNARDTLKGGHDAGSSVDEGTFAPPKIGFGFRV